MAEFGMTDYLACISPDSLGNWEICKRHEVWGVIQKGVSWAGRAAAERVVVGDQVFVWRGRPKRGPGTNGLLSRLEVLSDYRPVSPGDLVPWPEPEAFAGTFQVRVAEELPEPVTDRFVNHVSVRFGIENIALIHGFRELEPDVARRVGDVFH